MPDDSIHKKRRSVIFGIILVFFGMFLLFEAVFNINIINFIIQLWPFALILLGLKIIRKAQSRFPKKKKANADTYQADSDKSSATFADNIMQTTMIGDSSLRLATKNFQGGRATTIIGDIHINLSEIDFPPGEKIISITSIVGDVNLTLPKDFAYYIGGNAVIGDIQIFGQRAEGLFGSLSYRSEDYASSEKRLKIKVTTIIGDVHIA